MSIEDLYRDIDEYEELEDHKYAEALSKLAWFYENETREVYYKKQEEHNKLFQDYPKVNL